MAISNKNYPKAIPCRSPEELASQTARLNQLNEELTAQSKRLAQWNEDLVRRAARLRLWTFRMFGLCAAVIILSVVGVAFAFKYPGFITSQSPVSRAVIPPAPVVPELSATNDAMTVAPIVAPKVAPTELPARAIAKPDANAVAPHKAGYLEALGGLSATHLYQTHLNIGLLADGVESETYTVEEADKNLKTVVAMMKLVEGQLTKMTQTGLDPADRESIRQIQAITGLLYAQADALRAYWADGEKAQADRYHTARKAAWQGLSKVMGIN